MAYQGSKDYPGGENNELGAILGIGSFIVLGLFAFFMAHLTTSHEHAATCKAHDMVVSGAGCVDGDGNKYTIKSETVTTLMPKSE